MPSLSETFFVPNCLPMRSEGNGMSVHHSLQSLRLILQLAATDRAACALELAASTFSTLLLFAGGLHSCYFLENCSTIALLC